MKKPTPRQLAALEQAGIRERPADRRAAQALLTKLYRPKSRRGRSGRRATSRQEATA